MSAVQALVITIGASGGMLTTGLIFYGMRSDRHAKAANYLADHPVKSFLIGFLAFLIPFLVILGMIDAGSKDGWILVLALTVLIWGIGIGVAGRSLGERMMPDATPMMHTTIGSIILLGSLIWIFLGFFVVAIAVSMGFGAWLRARHLGPIQDDE